MDRDMQYTVDFDESAWLVRCKVAGAIQVDRVAAMVADGLVVARMHACRCALIDCREATARDSTTETFEIMSGLDRLGLERSDPIAVVYPKGAWSPRFAETVARNRGWRSIRFFTDLSAAEDWLQEARATRVS